MRLLAGASDERLVALAHAGDEQAFAAIVERYRAPLLRYCRGFVSGAAAEDAVQQTFINAYSALSRDDDSRVPAALRPWLYRIAHNAALNVARDPQAGLDELPENLERADRGPAVGLEQLRVLGEVPGAGPAAHEVLLRPRGRVVWLTRRRPAPRRGRGAPAGRPSGRARAKRAACAPSRGRRHCSRRQPRAPPRAKRRRHACCGSATALARTQLDGRQPAWSGPPA
jgi:hypothetical protein